MSNDDIARELVMIKYFPAITLTVLAAVAPVAAQTPPPPSPAVIVTTGEGVVKQAPDRVWVTIAAESRAKTAQDAQRMNADAMKSVNDRIKAAGIPADAIQTSGYNLQPEFDYANGKQTLRGYVARNEVTVRVDDLAKAGDVIAAAVASGATNVNNVRLDLKDRDAAERQALRLAVRDARQRADAAASGASVAVDKVIRIEEQRETEVVRPMAMKTMMRTEGGVAAPPIESGEIEVRSRVTLTVSIKP
jgi:uncharacterized protein